MSRIVIYTTAFCPYCHAAKDLLKGKGAEFSEIDVSSDPEERRRMTDKAGGRRTVPQIFIGERHVGGATDLYELDRKGELDPLLASP